jgi:hypothetical protein
MEDFVVAADLFVLVAEGVEAVRATGYDEFGTDAVEGLDIFVG